MKRIIALLLTIASILCCFAACAEDNITPDSVNLAVEATHDNVQALMLTGQVDVAVLPEPKATVAITQAKAAGFNYSVKLNVSNEWSAVSETELAMGCIAVRNSLIEVNEKGLVDFLAEYKSSIEYIGKAENKSDAAGMIVNAGILPKLPIANSALDNLYGAIVYEDGSAMKATLEGFYDAIGLTKPQESFYYTPNTAATSTSEKKIKIGVMNGPTGMGMAKLINDYGKDNAKYEFVMYSDPQLATADLTKGDIDIACLPTNGAANLSNKGAPIKVAATNCLGSLYVVVKDGVEVNNVKDLVGKTVYYGVPTSTTEPILRYVFGKNGMTVNLLDDENADG